MNFLEILTHTLPVFLMVGVGYLTRQLGVITEEAEKSIVRLVVNVLYPCFILTKIPGNESLQQLSVVFIALTAGFLLTLSGLFLSRLVGVGFKIEKKDGLNTFSVSTALQNYGFIPIPLIAALFPDVADQTLGVLFVHNLGLELAMWTVCIVLLSGTAKGAIKRLINGPTIAIIAGLLLNFTDFHHWIPSVAQKAILDLGNCTIPISLVLVGATLASVISSHKLQLQPKVIFGSLLVRFAIMPLAFIGVAALLTGSQELQRVLVVEAAMPAAIFPIVLAKHYGGKPNVAVQVCLATSLVSLALTPAWLLLGLHLLELQR
ncbi:MAG: AEC family transporter [Planctomycetaceae bacterium]|nr:AEC family transporter [Planctomycetaceae bacterium]MCP4776975.1 AEC family transporter [Planctomycetaceae bacterium]